MFYQNKNFKFTSTSQMVTKLRNYMNMTDKFDKFISALVTKSSFKTSVPKQNLIRALTFTSDPNFSMKCMCHHKTNHGKGTESILITFCAFS